MKISIDAKIKEQLSLITDMRKRSRSLILSTSPFPIFPIDEDLKWRQLRLDANSYMSTVSDLTNEQIKVSAQSHENIFVRASLAGFMAKNGMTDYVKEISALDEDWEVRRHAVKAIAFSEDAGKLDFLIKMSCDENGLVRSESARAMADHVKVPRVAARLMQLKIDVDPIVRAEAAWVLAVAT